ARAGPWLPRSGGGVESALTRDSLPPVQLGTDLDEHTLYTFRVCASRYTGHVGKALHGLERTAPEVDRVHRDPSRGIAPGQTGDHGPQQGGLAGLGPAQQDDVALAPGEVHLRGENLLFAWDVRQPDDRAHLRGVGLGAFALQVIA